MAESTRDTVKCPNCGTESETELWESLNSLLNYTQVDQLLEGTLFAHECPNCHCTLELTYPCLYNDMERGVMVQYIVDKEKTSEAIDIMEKMAAEDQHDDDMPITTRIVTTHNELREKVVIFRDGFDDKSMEAFKAVMMNRFIDEGQIKGGEAKCFYGGLADNGNLMLAFVEDGRSAEVEVPRSLYDHVHEMVEQTPASKDKAYIVDPIWAQLFFQKATR